MSRIEGMTFDDYYYDVYLPLHTKDSTRLCHVAGIVVTVCWVLAAPLLAWPHILWWLALSPLVVYPFAWFGHFVFEKNKPAAWSNPIWAKMSDWRMCWDILRGRL